MLAFPVTLLTAGSPPIEAVGVTSIPGFANLSTYLIATTRLWGGEANGLINVYRTNWLNVDAWAGFATSICKKAWPSARTFRSQSFQSLGPFSIASGPTTSFTVDNWGLARKSHYGRFFANLTGKVGLGDNHESITINGAQSVTFPGTSYTVYPSGFYAQPTNIGRQVRNELSVVPEGQAQVGLDVLRNVRLFAGYNFLYMSNVVSARGSDRPQYELGPVRVASHSVASWHRTHSGKAGCLEHPYRFLGSRSQFRVRNPLLIANRHRLEPRQRVLSQQTAPVGVSRVSRWLNSQPRPGTR